MEDSCLGKESFILKTSLPMLLRLAWALQDVDIHGKIVIGVILW